jgi:hypothetical protein
MDGEFHKRGVVNIITVLDYHNDIEEYSSCHLILLTPVNKHVSIL